MLFTFIYNYYIQYYLNNTYNTYLHLFKLFKPTYFTKSGFSQCTQYLRHYQCK